MMGAAMWREQHAPRRRGRLVLACLLCVAVTAAVQATGALQLLSSLAAGSRVLRIEAGDVVVCKPRQAPAWQQQATNSAGLEGRAQGGGGLAEPPDAAYLALCLLVRDEAPDRLYEWIDYHQSLGVGRFYVYDDRSQPPLHEALQRYIDAGVVVYRLLVGGEGAGYFNDMQQLAVYRDCVRHHGHRHKWLGPIDIDEFFAIRDCSPDLPSILRRYERYGALSVNWRMFGSSGQLFRPKGGVLESFDRCSSWNNPANMHVKVLLNTQYFANVTGNPHEFKYVPGKYAVTSNFSRVDGSFVYPPNHDVLSLSHYVIRSYEEFEGKMAKGGGAKGDNKQPKFWAEVEGAARQQCLYGVLEGQRLRRQREVAEGLAPAPSSAKTTKQRPVREKEDYTSREPPSNYTAICAVVKEEEPDRLREWVAYHKALWVGRIYLYGNASELSEALADFIETGHVKMGRLGNGSVAADGRLPVRAAYEDCLARYGGRHTWLGFLDADEFVMIHDNSSSLPAVLSRYESYGGLAINQRVFGSAGHVLKPPGTMLGTFRSCTGRDYGANTRVKTFVNTAHVARPSSWSPVFEYNEGYYAVNANRTRVDGPFSYPPAWEVLSLSHYQLKSFVEFKRKMVQRGAGSVLGENDEARQLWESVERASNETCTYGVAHGQRLRAAIAKAGGGSRGAFS